jgi:nicotinate-nucleotide adenylyltransferase
MRQRVRMLEAVKGQRIGLFGGTFDPPHWGHIRAVRKAADELGLDQMAFIPAIHPPHKEGYKITEYHHRQRMIELCLKYDDRFRISTVEEETGLSGKTLATVNKLREFGFTKDVCHLTWLMGSDSLLDLPLWHKPEELIGTIEIAVMPRPGFPIDRAEPRFRNSVRILNNPLFDYSATDIRMHHINLEGAVPKPVLDYIRAQQLYESSKFKKPKTPRA